MSLLTAVSTALLIGATGCGGKGSPSEPTGGPPSGPTGGATGGSGEMPAGWVKVTVPEGPCEIWMPGQPERTEAPTEWGAKNSIYAFADNNGHVWLISATHVPTAQQKAAIAAEGDAAIYNKVARDRVLKRTKGKLLSEKAIDHQGHPGLEFYYRDPDGDFTRHRLFDFGDQKFGVILQSKSKQENLTSKEAEAFFQSFRVLKDVATGGDTRPPDEAKSTSQPTAPVPADAGPAGTATSDAFTANSVWVNHEKQMTFTVLERDGDRFRARFQIGTTIDREVAGEVKGNEVSWLPKDVRAASGGAGGDNAGTFGKDRDGPKIDFIWRNNGGASGTFTLRLQIGK